MLAPCIRKHFAGPGLAGTRGVYGGIEGNLRLGELPQSPPWHCRGFHGFNSWIENRSLISLPRRQLGVKVGGSRAGASQFLKPESGGRGLSRKVQARASGEMVGVDVKVPKAKKVPHVTEMFGHVRENNYYWLRDDSRKEPEILEYLKSENDYTEAMTADTKAFQEELYKEMRGRIQEADTSVPLRKGAFFYYKRDLEGKQYPQHCRRATPDGERPGSVEEVMESGDGAAVETVLLDENAVAEKHSFYLVGTVKVSPNHKLFAVTEDFTGNEIFTLRVVDIETGLDVGTKITGATDQVEWGDDNTLYYLIQDETQRPYKVWRHNLQSDQSSDTCIYHEKDVEHWLDLGSSESDKYLLVTSASKITQFVLFLDKKNPDGELEYLSPRVDGVDISVAHARNHFFITRRSEETYNSELLVSPIEDRSAPVVLLPHRPSVKLQSVSTSKDHIVVQERENGLVTLTVYMLPPVGEPITSLGEGRKVEFPEPTYSVWQAASQYDSSVMRYVYSSLTTPPTVYDYDMNTGVSVLKKVQAVLGGFDSTKYVTNREWATADDGTQIPISLVYRKDLVKLDGSDPLLLYGYGSYEICIDPDFQSKRLSLLDRGLVFAIAHVRGGGEMGRKWYESGKLLCKKNTFTDFISCAEFLIEKKYGCKDKICINGRSAGGLLVGAVMTMRPELFTVAVAEVPFVDVVTTMLDESIPLTTSEWEEWGNPKKEEYYRYMVSYSPVDNVTSRNYPHTLITGGLHDSRVAYWEPAKFTAELREKKTDNNVLLFKCDMGAGHFSKSGRFDKLGEGAFVFTYILKYLGLLPVK
ncbi:oligopeptidase B [Marchantia polymorpha subsp. ruderalis]|uniref:Prolyl endopeptidase n=2 Tax=Marchantia polymorpha TaxID=3197 RepID=A0AAF6B919_MARPO|nr:hypothetical protein MARPO_0011s0194 [Marchantia polymorpha]BBN08503.1 hypothetical protein Mp_4g12120 [Marchantia polymorpha subsp. ruderalis]|eukprot:PTQ46537.1 hypothetical protein MARPO_0011s0194 [Marchantia polymorpha]